MPGCWIPLPPVTRLVYLCLMYSVKTILMTFYHLVFPWLRRRRRSVVYAVFLSLRVLVYHVIIHSVLIAGNSKYHAPSLASCCQYCCRYLHGKISEGDVHNIVCPDYGCYHLVPVVRCYSLTIIILLFSSM